MSKELINIFDQDKKNFTRRGAGVAERGGLENRCSACGTESSNLSLSAKKSRNEAAFLMTIFYNYSPAVNSAIEASSNW